MFLVTVAVPTPWLVAPPLASETPTEEIERPPALALTVAAPLPLPVPVPPINVEGGGLETLFRTGTGVVEGDGRPAVEKRITLADPEPEEVGGGVGDPQPNV